MFDKSKQYMEECLKAFGVRPLPPIVRIEGDRVSYEETEVENVVYLGENADVHKVPMIEWLVATGKALLHQRGSDMSILRFGAEWEQDEPTARVADDLDYVASLAAIYQCYLENPVEAFCMYDDAIEFGDENSLHPIAVALGMTHPKGLVALGFDPHTQADVFEEAEFFKGVVTRERPDLSLLVALQNVWQKQGGVDVRIELEEGILRFYRA